MNEERFYEEGEAEEILRRALSHTHSCGFDRARLLSMAAELGISESALDRAEADLQKEKVANETALGEQMLRREYRKWRRGQFWSNDVSNTIFASLVFTALWWFTGRGYFWPGWIIGIALLMFLINLFGEVIGFSETDYKRWRRKREKKEQDGEVEEGEDEI